MKVYRILLMVAFCSIFGANSAFAQCGADGRQNCDAPMTTPKKTTTTKETTPQKKTTTTTTTQTVAKTVTKIKQKPKNANVSLKNKLIGAWKNADGDTMKFLADGSEIYSDKSGVIMKMKWTLKEDIMTEESTWCVPKMDCTIGEVRNFKVEFNGERLLALRYLHADGTLDSDGNDEWWWTKVK